MFTLYFVFRCMVIYKHLSSFQKEHQFLFSALKAGFSHDSRDDERDEKDEKDDESIEEIYVNEQSKADVYVNFWKYVVCFHKKTNIYIQIHDVVETVEYMLFTKWHSKPKGEIEKENHLMSKQN